MQTDTGQAVRFLPVFRYVEAAGSPSHGKLIVRWPHSSWCSTLNRLSPTPASSKWKRSEASKNISKGTFTSREEQVMDNIPEWVLRVREMLGWVQNSWGKSPIIPSADNLPGSQLWSETHLTLSLLDNRLLIHVKVTLGLMRDRKHNPEVC